METQVGKTTDGQMFVKVADKTYSLEQYLMGFKPDFDALVKVVLELADKAFAEVK